MTHFTKRQESRVNCSFSCRRYSSGREVMFLMFMWSNFLQKHGELLSTLAFAEKPVVAFILTDLFSNLENKIKKKVFWKPSKKYPLMQSICWNSMLGLGDDVGLDTGTFPCLRKHRNRLRTTWWVNEECEFPAFRRAFTERWFRLNFMIERKNHLVFQN